MEVKKILWEAVLKLIDFVFTSDKKLICIYLFRQIQSAR